MEGNSPEKKLSSQRSKLITGKRPYLSEEKEIRKNKIRKLFEREASFTNQSRQPRKGVRFADPCKERRGEGQFSGFDGLRHRRSNGLQRSLRERTIQDPLFSVLKRRLTWRQKASLELFGEETLFLNGEEFPL